ncbi:hypothetical protein B0H65DRAFT_293548 [Neurospora tetraspora]|uniref:Uncharacterized protein n=1 Tax=Neurospora tetraspora TaxID=94610 RepID=A0AAE0J916_9PEZI|nr:hypothetical protein B0H65DRAFT_293548 [Neurospora tetraspora]
MHGVRCRVALPALLGIRHRAFLLHLVAPNFLLSETLSFSRCCCCRHYSNQTLLIVCKKPLTLSRLFTNHTEPEEGAKGREEAERGGEAQSGLENARYYPLFATGIPVSDHSTTSSSCPFSCVLCH